jgi:SAM-dependent methyltransferase
VFFQIIPFILIGTETTVQRRFAGQESDNVQSLEILKMDEKQLDAAYWEGRYQDKDTGWDIGAVSAPIKAYADQLTDLQLRILIPGCGYGYEAEYLWKKGFKNVYVADYAAEPLKKFHQRVPDFPVAQLLECDFFALEGMYDRILEQTFFCALHPSLRAAYARKISTLLAPGGFLAGVLFDDPLYDDQPPYGGNEQVYKTCFEPYLRVLKMERCYNSIAPRAGRELFVKLAPLGKGI